MLKKFFIALAALWFSAGIAWAEEAGARLLALKAELSDVISISGEFMQEKRLDFLSEPLVSRGKFRFARPDVLEWEYTEPAPSGLTVRGGRAEAWSGPLESRARQPEGVAEAARLVAGQVMLWMNLDPDALAAAYTLTIIQSQPLVVEAVPRRGAARKFMEALRVEFSPDGRTVRRVTLREPESTTVLTFSRVRLNQPAL